MAENKPSIEDRIKECEAASAKLEGQSVNEILQWAYGRFGNKLGMMSALGYSGLVVMDHLVKLGLDIDVYFIDTGFNFPETMDLLKKLQETSPLKIQVLNSSCSVEELKEKVGEKPWEVNPDLCCHHMKIEPLLNILHTKDAWLSAIRRDQSVSRAEIDVVEVDGRGTIKVYPLADWSYEKTWQYIKDNDLNYNELHDQGYPSIGCTHCTDKVADGEHERTGRWNSMPKLECGLHLHKN